MHDLAFLTLGLLIGSGCTVALLALMHAAHDADEWGEQLHDYAGEGEIYDHTKDAGRPFADVGYRIRAYDEGRRTERWQSP
jgi:hypothetical protein